MYEAVAYEPGGLETANVHAVASALVADVVAAIAVWVSGEDVVNAVDCVAFVVVAVADVVVVPIVADASFADGDAFAVDAAGHFANVADVVKENVADVVAHDDEDFVAYDFAYAVVVAGQLAVAIVVVVAGDVVADTD